MPWVRVVCDPGVFIEQVGNSERVSPSLMLKHNLVSNSLFTMGPTGHNGPTH